MKNYIRACMGLPLIFAAAGIASAQGGLQFTVPGASIGIQVPAYPRLAPVPGYPVYYAPELDNNFFFYDGLYWFFTDDRWYRSEWYDGPWEFVEPESVPYFVLRVPVRYYRHPPPDFLEWDRRRPPRWGEHWGRDWEQRHRDWNQWNRGARPSRAPLPDYQRNYPRDRYPAQDQQRPLRDREYNFRPRAPQDRQTEPNPAGGSQPPARPTSTPPRNPNVPPLRRNVGPERRPDPPGAQRPTQAPQKTPPP